MAVSLSALWMAVLLAGVLCWFASALIHMLLKYHNFDYHELSNEQEVVAALNASSPSPALYTMPYCADMKQMGDEAMQKKFHDGPVAVIAVMQNGMPPMGKLLLQQFLFFISGAMLIGYLATLSMVQGAEYMSVFRFVFVAAFVTYAWAQIPHSIWLGQPWSNCVRYIIDALIYSAVTAGAFAWLWP